MESFEKKLKLVRLRCYINLLLEQSAYVLAGAGIVAVAVVLAERLLALRVVNSGTLWSFASGAAGLIFLLWFSKRPDPMQVSLLIDQRLRLHERFSTTLALDESEDVFAQASRTEAHNTARRISLKGHFPIQPSRCWLYAIGVWLMAGALVLFMPQKDLLGFLKKREQQQEHTQKVQLAEVEIKQAADKIKSAVRQLGDNDLQNDMAKLDEIPKGGQPENIKRQAIRKLGDLSDKIKTMRTSKGLESVNPMKKMLKQLRGSPDAFSQKLRLALAKGDFAQASNLLDQLQKQLMEGKLPGRQQKDLARQLRDLARQLQELARENEQLEKELEKLGLNKQLAKLSKEQLRQALQKQGLSAEKIERLLQKAAACRTACSRCARLGQAMAACGGGAGGLSEDELATVMEQLDELEALQQQFMLTQAGLDEIRNAIACLGQGMCQGPGCQGAFREGLSNRYGCGTGGPGKGFGPRSTDEDGDTSTKKTRVKSDAKQGPVIASWYFKGSQVKGEAKRDFSEVIQSAGDSAAEAISENQIPRKYEEAVKKYFGQLEESGGK